MKGKGWVNSPIPAQSCPDPNFYFLNYRAVVGNRIWLVSQILSSPICSGTLWQLQCQSLAHLSVTWYHNVRWPIFPRQHSSKSNCVAKQDCSEAWSWCWSAKFNRCCIQAPLAKEYLGVYSKAPGYSFLLHRYLIYGIIYDGRWAWLRRNGLTGHIKDSWQNKLNCGLEFSQPLP